MNLRKRECGIRIALEPTGAQFLGVDFDFDGVVFSFNPSSAVSGQFGDVLSALYSLFQEGYDYHDEWFDRDTVTDENNIIMAVTANITWDNEGTEMYFGMTREYAYAEDTEEVILIEVKKTDGEYYSFKVKAKDFCYAVAKACTDALKRYGVYGYRYSTENDTFRLHQLLFIKAYALGNAEARELLEDTEDEMVRRTDFAKEMELLLFDM